MIFDFNCFIQGLSGNMNKQSIEALQNEFSQFLIYEENIQTGFKLMRDTIIFTNLRIIFAKKQGATGSKTSVKSIFLSQIVNVEIETAGFGMEDSKMTITYLENVYLKPSSEKLLTRKFEFPNKTDITTLYKYLFKLAYTNRLEINK